MIETFRLENSFKSLHLSIINFAFDCFFFFEIDHFYNHSFKMEKINFALEMKPVFMILAIYCQLAFKIIFHPNNT